MPYITSVHESLPYIDAEPSDAQRSAAEALVAAERATVPDDPHHALLRPAYTAQLTPAMQAEVDRVAANESLKNNSSNGGSGAKHNKKATQLDAIDLSRYEVDDDEEDNDKDSADNLQERLARAYTSQAYLRGRRAHLALLDRFGKNAWLVGNWQVEAELRAAEAALAQARRDVDMVTLQRQRVQHDAAAELHALEDAWRTGVGRVLETEAAAEDLRLQTLDARRRLATDNSGNN